WQCEGNQTVQEFPHTVSAHGDVCTNRHAFAQFELCDGFLGAGYLWFLAGDRGEVFDGTVDDFGVTCGFTDAHVDHDLFQTWYLHDVFVAELVLEFSFDFVAVFALQTWGDLGGCVFRYLCHYSSFPEALA